MSGPINLLPAEMWHTSGACQTRARWVCGVWCWAGQWGALNHYHLQQQMASPQCFPPLRRLGHISRSQQECYVFMSQLKMAGSRGRTCPTGHLSPGTSRNNKLLPHRDRKGFTTTSPLNWLFKFFCFCLYLTCLKIRQQTEDFLLPLEE